MAMVNCPKCGFGQPADQYCASCGVDMKAWKPKQKPLLVRIASNTVVQVVIVTVVIAVGFSIMRDNRARQLAERVRQIEIARQAEEQERELYEQQAQTRPRQTRFASESAQAAPAAPAPQARAFAPPSPQSPGTSTSSNFAATSASAALVGGAPEGKTSSVPTQAQLTFYEMSRNVATTLLTGSSQGTGEGSLTFGVVAGVEAKMRNQQGTRSLDATTVGLQVNQPAILYKGARDPSTGANIGFTLQINPIAIDENGAQLQIDIIRALRDATAGVEEVNFAPAETFTVPKGSALVVSGLLPRKTSSEADATFYRNVGVLRPLASAAFMAGTTDAVLVIEAK